ncbi:MAG: SAM-dependent methyltransferase, partial [Roseovarius sp.]
IACEGLDFAMASPKRYEAALKGAGFQNVRLVSRNAWYKEQAKAELERLTGEGRAEFEAILGPKDVLDQIATWEAMVPVVASGEHCPHHFRGQKP